MLQKLQLALAASVLSLAAGVSSADAATTVRFWHSFNKSNGEALDKIIAGFEAANPDTDIEAEYIGSYNDIIAKLQAAIPARRAPDAVILEVTRYGLFANNNLLTDLTPYFDADPLKDDLYDYAREVGVINGKNYVVPFNSSTPVLYFNKDIFARAGLPADTPLKTFEDISTAAKTITEKLGSQGISGIAAPGQFARWGLVMANDSEMIDPKTGEIVLDKPNTIEASFSDSRLSPTSQPLPTFLCRRKKAIARSASSCVRVRLPIASTAAGWSAALFMVTAPHFCSTGYRLRATRWQVLLSVHPPDQGRDHRRAVALPERPAASLRHALFRVPHLRNDRLSQRRHHPTAETAVPDFQISHSSKILLISHRPGAAANPCMAP